MPYNEWHFAVAVGIDEYPRIDDGQHNLRLPAQDARDVANWLGRESGGGVPPENLTLITRTDPTRPPPVPVQDEVYDAVFDTVDRFRAKLSALSTAVDRMDAWSLSRFYFYISGHGMDGDGDDATVLTANARYRYLLHVSTRGLKNGLLKEGVFAEIVVFADSCRELPPTTLMAPPFDFSGGPTFTLPNYPRCFFACASRNRKKAYEPPAGSPITNGFFTSALLCALNGGVGEPSVDSDSLRRYLYNAVPDLARQYLNVDQHPEILSADPGILFVPAVAPTLYSVTVRIPAGSSFAGTAALEAVVYINDTVQARHAFAAAADGSFGVSLSSGGYVVIPAGADLTAPGVPAYGLTVLTKAINVDLP